MEIHVLETQGLSIRAIGGKFGVSRNTVRRYLRDRSLISIDSYEKLQTLCQQLKQHSLCSNHENQRLYSPP